MRSDEFVPVYAETVKLKALNWPQQYQLDAIFSTVGDGDRLLVADDNGDWLRGDTLELSCSRGMNIETVTIPMSCNTVVECTKIGSPYVIVALTALAKYYTSVAGFEVNGVYLLGSDEKRSKHCPCVMLFYPLSCCLLLLAMMVFHY